MTDAFVNVTVQPGAVSSTASAIQGLDTVSDVHVVTGEYDIVAQLDLADPDDLPGVVAEEIHALSGVADTITNVAYEP